MTLQEKFHSFFVRRLRSGSPIWEFSRKLRPTLVNFPIMLASQICGNAVQKALGVCQLRGCMLLPTNCVLILLTNTLLHLFIAEG